MERIEEIKQRRQNQYIMNRLKVGEQNRTEDDLKEVKDFMHLIKAPHGNTSTLQSPFIGIKYLILKNVVVFLAKNPELERLHEAASRRLADLRFGKQTLTQLRKSKRPLTGKGKERGKVEVTMEENVVEQNNAELVAEEN